MLKRTMFCLARLQIFFRAKAIQNTIHRIDTALDISNLISILKQNKKDFSSTHEIINIFILTFISI